MLDNQEEGNPGRPSAFMRQTPPAAAPPRVKESRNVFKRMPKKEPAKPVVPEPKPKLESEEPPPVVVEAEPPRAEPPVVTAAPAHAPPSSPRDLAEQETIDLILRARRVAKSTGAPLEVCLEELRKQLKPPAAEAAKASKVRRFEFQSSPEGLLTGAKLIEE